MKALLAILRLRAARGFGITSLGPNEGRFLFDILVATFGVVALWTITAWLVPGRWEWSLVALPFVTVGILMLVGIYSRLRLAAIPRKAVAILLAVVLAAASVSILTGAWGLAFSWAIIVAPILVLPRALLGLGYSRDRRLARVLVNSRGPTLVCGGGGYIGTHVVEQLLNAGKTVRVLDREMYGGAPLADFASNPRFELFVGDVTDIGVLSSAMRDVSSVVHLAGLVGDPSCAVDPEFTRHQNIVATGIVREIAESAGVQQFVFASSCSVYGMSDHEIGESGPLNPLSLYAQTKIDSERALLSGGSDNFFVTVLRFATVFGHSRRPRFDLVANLFTAQAMTDGLITVIGSDQWRPFIHVRDLGRAVRLVLETRPELVQTQIFNVGDRNLNMTIGQLAASIQRITTPFAPSSISTRDDVQDRRNYAVSFDKIRTTLSFEAMTSLDAGIAEIAEHFVKGTYRDWRAPQYSNVAVTSAAAEEFHDPATTKRLYAPLGR